MDKAQAICLDACFPQSWWEFAVLHAVHLYNQTPMRHLGYKTPFEALRKSKPSVAHFCVFGCGAYVCLPKVVSVKAKLIKIISSNLGANLLTLTSSGKKTYAPHPNMKMSNTRFDFLSASKGVL